MKALIVYYSLEGNTKLIADAVADELKCDVLQLKPKKDVPNKGFLRFVLGGKQVVFNEKPELESFDVDFEKYDLIIMGSPVWAGSYASSFNAFFSRVSITGKKIALFCCYAGNEGKTFSMFKKQLEKNEIIGQMGFKDPLKNKQQSIKSAKQWMGKCIKAVI